MNKKLPPFSHLAVIAAQHGKIEKEADTVRKMEEWVQQTMEAKRDFNEELSPPIRIAVLISTMPNHIQEIIFQRPLLVVLSPLNVGVLQ